jgi:hypothetical protein
LRREIESRLMGVTSRRAIATRTPTTNLTDADPLSRRSRAARVSTTAARHWKARARAIAAVVQLQSIPGTHCRSEPRPASSRGYARWGVSIRPV